MDKWLELKAHVEKQFSMASALKGNAGRIITHVWRDVKNKMWSLEQNERKK